MGDRRAHLNSAALGMAQLLTEVMRLDEAGLQKAMEHYKAASLDETIWDLFEHVKREIHGT